MATDDLLEALRHLPDQVRDAAVSAADVEGLPGPGEITEVVIVGAGTGGVAGDVVESVAHLQGSVPVLATGGISPAWLSESSLVVAVSQSGDDRPTVAATRVARDRGARMVAVTSGGELMELCSNWGVPVARVDPFAGPAAGLGVVIVPVLVLLERVGVLSGMNRLISESAEQIEVRRRLIDADAAPARGDGRWRAGTYGGGVRRPGGWASTRRVAGSTGWTASPVCRRCGAISRPTRPRPRPGPRWPGGSEPASPRSCYATTSSPPGSPTASICSEPP